MRKVSQVNNGGFDMQETPPPAQTEPKPSEETTWNDPANDEEVPDEKESRSHIQGGGTG